MVVAGPRDDGRRVGPERFEDLALEDDAHDVLADVVDVALDGAQHDLARRARALAGHVGTQEIEGSQRGPGAQHELGNEQLALLVAPAHELHYLTAGQTAAEQAIEAEAKSMAALSKTLASRIRSGKPASAEARQLIDSANKIDALMDTDGMPEAASEGIPVTYVPARNTVFLALALGWAEVLGATDLFVGVNAVDYSGYPDCRPEFIEAFEAMANLATKRAVEGCRMHIHTPLIKLTKSEIIQRGMALGVDYALTVSCYQADGDGRACGRCDSCRIRREGFAAAGVEDPTEYAPTPALP